MINWAQNNKGLVVIILAILSLVGTVFAFMSTQSPDEPNGPIIVSTIEPTAEPTSTPISPTIEIVEPVPQPTSTSVMLRVDVGGAVKNPDVYLLPPRSIIKDAIAAAGGVTTEADLTIVNQAEEIKDQQKIYIPTKSQNLPPPPVTSGGEDPPTANENNNTDDGSGNNEGPSARKININTASSTELQLLKGVGPSTAQKIIDYREDEGPFTAIEDLMEVKGIGSATFEKLKDYIVVE